MSECNECGYEFEIDALDDGLCDYCLDKMLEEKKQFEREHGREL